MSDAERDKKGGPADAVIPPALHGFEQFRLRVGT